MISPLAEQIVMPGELQSRMLFNFNPSDGKELEFDFSLDDLETAKVIEKDSGGVSHPFIKKFENKDLDLEILIDKDQVMMTALTLIKSKANLHWTRVEGEATHAAYEIYLEG
ncbi:hypothetical protein RIF29_06453 [Crotalaria pallida]|uniref:Uncharacterized protein n=1 Tax=Crotalaria pallida TaxID=3830 RepID=A0AAN9J373_CROPI